MNFCKCCGIMISEFEDLCYGCLYHTWGDYEEENKK
jgi:hypothetical protein